MKVTKIILIVPLGNPYNSLSKPYTTEQDHPHLSPDFPQAKTLKPIGSAVEYKNHISKETSGDYDLYYDFILLIILMVKLS